jgi:rSAM/selenodomain-associated transferase 1
MMLDDLSVVIPVGPGELAWRALLPDLKYLPASAEVLLVGVDAEPEDFQRYAATVLPCTARWLQSEAGRARQLNHGAGNAAGSILWFLHADSRVDPATLDALDDALRNSRDAIHYFELAFQADGPRLIGLNAWGANFRSRFLRLPFGDQGFCLAKHKFLELGRFDETVEYGEDHLFIWKAHRGKVSVKRVAATLTTSARKYRQHGWLRLTCAHLWRTGRQALPQIARLLMDRQRRMTPSLPSPPVGNRLIVFTRCPELGRCKTRLIPTLGADGAVAIHEALVRRTMAWIGSALDEGIAVDVHYAGDDLERLRGLCGEAVGRITFEPQNGEDLGRRMANAFDPAIHQSSKVAMIGTDCPELDLELVQAAFRHLDETDLVLGPAVDGGYYLIALRRPAAELFQDIRWGGPTVLQETLERAQGLQMTFELLPTLADVDRPEDLDDPAYQRPADRRIVEFY